MSLPSSIFHPPSSPSSKGWLSLAEASRRSGRSLGHLGRRCLKEWIASGKARSIIGGGKRGRYEVAEDADPSFSRVKFPEQIGTNLSGVADGKRREAMAKRQILDAWEKAKAGRHALGFTEAQITSQFVAHYEATDGRRLTRATLYNWYRAWRLGGLEGLVDGRGNCKSQIANRKSEADPFLEEVKRLYLRQPKKTLTLCREIAMYAAGSKGWEVRTYKTCQRFIAAIPAGIVSKFRDGDEAFVNDSEPYIERDKTTLQSNELWCGDHHQFDVFVNAGGKLVRPWVTAWEDQRSGKIVGWKVFAHDPNGTTILYAFRHGALANGVPCGVYIDNGKDYDSYSLNGRTKKDRFAARRIKVVLEVNQACLFPSLGISVTHALPFHGQSKPIERFFGTVEQATPVWDTYCGRNTASKPDCLQINLERGKAPSIEDFSDWFDAWVATHNARPSQADGLDGKSPDVVFAENLHTKRTAPRELLDIYCLATPKPVNVGQNGVEHKGLRFGQYEPALFPLRGKTVQLRVDDGDLWSVQVWTVEGTFICVAPANKKLPFIATEQELREAKKQKSNASKAIRDYHESRIHIHEDLPDLMLRARAAANQAATSNDLPPSPPPSLMPIRSALEDQLPALQRAVEASRGTMRIAVGAEELSRTGNAGGFEYRASFSADEQPEDAAFSYPSLSTQHSALDNPEVSGE